jgi:hypothetical protein
MQKNIKYVQSACALSCILSYSVHNNKHINYTKKDLITKAVLLTSCKHGQKFQLSSVYHDFLKLNKQLPGSYPHLYKMLCLISVFRTVHQWSPFRANKSKPYIPKLLLQNTFQYYPSINGYDFQKFSSLKDCNPNSKSHMAPTI